MAPLFELAGTFIFGLIIGSFLNVCIYRIPRGQSVAVPRSYCPDCGRFIRWYDNIPLASYLLLGSACRSCKKRISPQYPAVELLTGLLSSLTALRFGHGLPYFLYFLLLVAPLVAVFFIDLQHKIIPNIITLPGIAAGLATTLLISHHIGFAGRLIPPLTGALIGGGALFLVSWLYEKIRGQEGIGMGDVKLAAMLGTFFAPQGILLTLFLSSFLGSITGLILILFFKKGSQTQIPFGPFLSLAGWINLLCGPEIVTAYLRMIHN